MESLNPNEKTIWEGSPSQWGNVQFYILCIPLVMLYGLGLLLMLWKYFETDVHHIHITDQRIIEKRGILSTLTKELELYRVKDIKYREPFLFRLVHLSSIVLSTSDMDSKEFKIVGIRNGYHIKEQLRTAIDIRRDLKGVREIDI